MNCELPFTITIFPANFRKLTMMHNLQWLNLRPVR